MSRVRLVTETTLMRPRSLRLMLDKIDVGRVATVEHEVGRLEGAPGSATLVEDRAEKIVVATNASGYSSDCMRTAVPELWCAWRVSSGRATSVSSAMTVRRWVSNGLKPATKSRATSARRAESSSVNTW
jgi:hypothetical protein